MRSSRREARNVCSFNSASVNTLTLAYALHSTHRWLHSFSANVCILKMLLFDYLCLRLQCSVITTTKIFAIYSINTNKSRSECLHCTFLDLWVYKIYFACINEVFFVLCTRKVSNVECRMFILSVE